MSGYLGIELTLRTVTKVAPNMKVPPTHLYLQGFSIYLADACYLRRRGRYLVARYLGR